MRLFDRPRELACMITITNQATLGHRGCGIFSVERFQLKASYSETTSMGPQALHLSIRVRASMRSRPLARALP